MSPGITWTGMTAHDEAVMALRVPGSEHAAEGWARRIQDNDGDYWPRIYFYAWEVGETIVAYVIDSGRFYATGYCYDLLGPRGWKDWVASFRSLRTAMAYARLTGMCPADRPARREAAEEARRPEPVQLGLWA